MCDVIKQNQSEIGNIDFKIHTNKTENVFCFLLFWALWGENYKVFTQGQIQVWADPPGPSSPFWQLNHANSAYFGAISANFLPVLTLGPLFLQILDLAL